MEVKRALVTFIAILFVLSAFLQVNGSFLPQQARKDKKNLHSPPFDKGRQGGFSEDQRDKNVPSMDLPADQAGSGGFPPTSSGRRPTPQKGISEKGKDIIDIKPLEKIERDYRKIFFIATIIILSICLLLVVYFYYKKKSRKPATQILIPAHELALKEFNELKKKRLLENGEFRQYYFAFSEIFRRYLERRFLFPATESTSEEIISLLQQVGIVNQEYFLLGKDFLLKTDLVKFAKYFPLKDEIDRTHENFLKFIEATKEDVELKTLNSKS